MKNFSNRYIFLYSAALVAVCAVLLSVVAMSLRDRQRQNVAREQKQMILRAVGVDVPTAEVDRTYAAMVTDSLVGDNQPIYLYHKDGKTGSVIPLRGRGLWGAIWAYVALDEDFRIVGAVFDHASETPGLGGEITPDKFRNRFVVNRITDDDGHLMPVSVKKHANPSSAYEVDAITGGTLTSNGVSEMFGTGFAPYKDYIERRAAL